MKYSTKRHLHAVLTAIEDAFGHLPNGLGTGVGDLSAEAAQLRAEAFAAGHAAGLVEGRRGWRPIEAIGKAQAVVDGESRPGDCMSKQDHRDVLELIKEGWSDPLKDRRRTRDDKVRVRSRAKIVR